MKKFMVVFAIAIAMAVSGGIYAEDVAKDAVVVKKEVKDMNLDELKKLLAEKQAALKAAGDDEVAQAAIAKEIKAIEAAIKAKTPVVK